MNPFLASGLILILRWLQHIACKEVLSIEERSRIQIGLLDETAAFSQRLTDFTLQSNEMSSNNDVDQYKMATKKLM